MRASLMLLFALLLCAEATHFRFVAVSWRRGGANGVPEAGNREITFYHQLSYRRTYGSWDNLNQGGYASGACDFVYGDGQASVSLGVNIESISSAADWWLGSRWHTHLYGSDRKYSAYTSDCCRISSLRAGQNDKDYKFQTDLDLTKRDNLYSPVTNSLPIITVMKAQGNGYTEFSFDIPMLDYDADDRVTCRKTSRSRSGIDNLSAIGVVTDYPIAGVSNNGQCVVTWKIPSGTGLGLYALALEILDDNGAVVPLDFIMELINFDPLMPIITYPGRPSQDANVLPRSPVPGSIVDAFYGAETRITISGWGGWGNGCTQSNGLRPASAGRVPYGGGVRIINGVLPPRASVQVSPDQTDRCCSGSNCLVAHSVFTWTPNLGDDNQNVCFQAQDISAPPGGGFPRTSVGTYCITIRIGESDYVYLSGVIRDFTASHPDFAVSGAETLVPGRVANNLVQWPWNDRNSGTPSHANVPQGDLSKENLVYKPVSGGSNGGSQSRSQFTEWWETATKNCDNGSNANARVPCAGNAPDQTTCEGRGCCWHASFNNVPLRCYHRNKDSGSSSDETGTAFQVKNRSNQRANMDKVHSITLSDAGVGTKEIYRFESSSFYPIDNELLGNEKSGSAINDHNKYFTYEIHTFILYDVNNASAWETFTYKSKGDLWIFMDGQLVADLGGRHPEREVMLDLQTLQTSHGFVPGETYSYDIFYAHRLSDSSFNGDPGLWIETLQTQTCSVLSKGSPAFSITDFSNSAQISSSDLSMRGKATIAGADLSLIKAQPNHVSGISAVWYSTLMPVTSGFTCTFKFKIAKGSGTPEGLAFVLQSAGDIVTGGSGGNIGYSDIANSIAIEIDTKYDAQFGDPDGEHVSFHSGLHNGNSPSRVVDSTVPIKLTDAVTDGAEHKVYITYTPDPWLRVFIDDNPVPINSANINLRNEIFLDGLAYPGFTTSNGANNLADITITEWEFSIVEPGAALSVADSIDPVNTAGVDGSFDIILRDLCGNEMNQGGFGDIITVKFTLCGSAAAPSDIAACPVDARDTVITQNFHGDGADMEDLLNGRYRVTYPWTKAGIYRVDVSVDGKPISNSPFPLKVVPAAPYAPNCYLQDAFHCTLSGNTCSGAANTKTANRLLDGRVAETSTFHLVPFDFYGNAVQCCVSEKFDIVLRGPSGNIAGTSSQRADGLFELTYQTSVAASAANAYTASISLFGEFIDNRGTPSEGFKVAVLPARAHGPNTPQVGSYPVEFETGQSVQFDIQPIDIYQNQVIGPGDDIVLEFEIRVGNNWVQLNSATDASFQIPSPYTIDDVPQPTYTNDQPDFNTASGFYEPGFTGSLVGVYRITPVVNGQDAKNNLQVTITAGPEWPATTQVVDVSNAPLTTISAVAGVVKVFYVLTYDQFGNRRTRPNIRHVFPYRLDDKAGDAVFTQGDVALANMWSVEIVETGASGSNTLQCIPSNNVPNVDAPLSSNPTRVACSSASTNVLGFIDENNGRYQFTFVATQATRTKTYEIVVNLWGYRINGDSKDSLTSSVYPTYNVEVLSGAANGEASKILGTNDVVIDAGAQDTFKVDIYDRWENPRSEAVQNDVTKLDMSLNPAAAFTGLPTNTPVKSGSEYTIQWSSTAANQYRLLLKISGQDIVTPAAFNRRVIPVSTDVSATSVSGPGMVGGSAGQDTNLVIHPRDQYNNNQLGHTDPEAQSPADEFNVVIVENPGKPSEKITVSPVTTTKALNDNCNDFTCTGNEWQFVYPVPTGGYEVYVYLGTAPSTPSTTDANLVAYNTEADGYTTDPLSSFAIVDDSTWNDATGYTAGSNTFVIVDWSVEHPGCEIDPATLFASGCEISKVCSAVASCSTPCLMPTMTDCSSADDAWSHGIPPFQVSMSYLGPTGSDSPVSLGPGSAVGTVGAVSYDGTNNGRFTAQYTAKKVGLYSVAISVRGKSIWYPQDTSVQSTRVCEKLGSPASCATTQATTDIVSSSWVPPVPKTDLLIIHDEPNDDMCILVVDPNSAGSPRAGEAYTMRVTLKDQYGNIATRPGYESQLQLTFNQDVETAQTTITAVSGTAGDYDLTFVPKVMGPLNVRVEIFDATHFKEANLNVLPGIMAAVGSYMLVPPGSTIAGETNTFQIFPQDKYGNPTAPTSDDENVIAVTAATGFAFVSAPTISIQADFYTVQFSAETASAAFQAQVTFPDPVTSAPIAIEPLSTASAVQQGSPLGFRVFVADMDPTKTDLSDSVITSQVSGTVPAAQPTSFDFVAMDRFGNLRETCPLNDPCTTSDGTIELVLTGPETLYGSITKALAPGTWTATFEGTTAGVYTVTMSMFDGTAVTQTAGSFQVTICFGEVDFTRSVFTPLLPTNSVPASTDINTAHLMLLQMKDFYGNLRTPGVCGLDTVTQTGFVDVEGDLAAGFTGGDQFKAFPYFNAATCTLPGGTDSHVDNGTVLAPSQPANAQVDIRMAYISGSPSQEVQDIIALRTAGDTTITAAQLAADQSNYIVAVYGGAVGTYSYDLQVQQSGVYEQSRGTCYRTVYIVPGALDPPSTQFFLLDGVTQLDPAAMPAMSATVGENVGFLMKFFDKFSNPIHAETYSGALSQYGQYDFMETIVLGDASTAADITVGHGRTTYNSAFQSGQHRNASNWVWKSDDNGQGWILVSFNMEEAADDWQIRVFVDGVAIPHTFTVEMKPDIVDRTRVPTTCDFERDGAPIEIVDATGRTRSYIMCTTPVSQQPLIAGVPSAFALLAVDRFENQVIGTAHTYGLTATRDDDGRLFPAGDPTLDALVMYPSNDPYGNTTDIRYVYFTPIWHGNYSAQINLVLGIDNSMGAANTPNAWTRTTGSGLVKGYGYTIVVGHATCAYSDPAKPYRCPDQSCAAAYSDCTDLTSTDLEDDISNAVFNNPSTLQCPQGMVACAHVLQCVDDAAYCPEAPATCPAYAAHRCDGTSLCRADVNSCPSKRVCSPGWTMCPDQLTCARTAGDCQDVTNSVDMTGKEGWKVCPDGSIRETVHDCPTPKTCHDRTNVVCPDGSCRASKTECPSLYDCFYPNTYRCPYGECRQTADACPSRVVCPEGFVLCENEKCAQSVDQCPNVNICNDDQVRCPDGSCRDNLLLCSNDITCPVSTVRCSDGSCASSVQRCDLPPVIPSGKLQCKDGSLVNVITECPTETSCPSSHPILCNDGTCAPAVSKCTTAVACPESLSYKCPDGSCKAALEQCGTQVKCPDNAPIKCPDGSCRTDINQCASPDLIECGLDLDDVQTLRCPDGSCASSLALCATPSTCPVGLFKCADLSCRSDCSIVTDTIVTCGSSDYANLPVTCPDGISCRASLSDCPTAIVCPSDRPVKCQDTSCRAALEECPSSTNENTFECYIGSTAQTQPRCPDGTCLSSQSARCAAAVTCHPSEPFICSDNTCRQSAEDCVDSRQCTDASNPFLCSDGTCAPARRDCQAPFTPCPTTSPVLCATGACVVSATQCPITLGQPSCPTGTRCTDGSCMTNTQCPYRTKDTRAGKCVFPMIHLCEDGMCATDAAHCTAYSLDTNTGCPANKPHRCFYGACVSDASQCLLEVNVRVPVPTRRRRLLQTSTTELRTEATLCQGQPDGTVACPDGSCAQDAASCNHPNGCPTAASQCNNLIDYRFSFSPLDCTDTMQKCHNRFCVANVVVPDQCGMMPSCPYNYPQKCDNGLCVKTLSDCPVTSAANDGWCTDSALPHACADGACVADVDQCRPLYPCPDTHKQCLDGSCMVAGASCPVAQESTNCIGTRPYLCGFEGETDVYRGVCAASKDQCFPLSGSQANRCPQGQVECQQQGSYGACVDDVADCADNFQNPSGCSGTDEKCSNGACISDLSQCLTSENCQQGEKRCADGLCIANADPCSADLECPANTVRCADQSCAASFADCRAANGCLVSAPQRCQNGDCVVKESDCPSTVQCSTWAPIRCADGSCQNLASMCAPVQSCPAATPVRCPNTAACAATAAACVDACPATQNVRCKDGSCVQTSTECPSTTDKCLAPAPTLCDDGSCQSEPQVCWDQKNTLRLSDPSLACDYICSDGSCADNPFDCNPAAACTQQTGGRFRCLDGTCVGDKSECDPDLVAACPNANEQRCPDGICSSDARMVNQGGVVTLQGCSGVFGCGVDQYQCQDGNCVADPSECNLWVLSPDEARGVCGITATAQNSTACGPHQVWMRHVKANEFSISFSAAEVELAIAREEETGTDVMFLSARPNTVTDPNNPNGEARLEISAVPTSLLQHSIFPDQTRTTASDGNRYSPALAFDDAVLSSVFRCSAATNSTTIGGSGITIRAFVDRDSPSTFQNNMGGSLQGATRMLVQTEDICLATYSIIQGWECVVHGPDGERRVQPYPADQTEPQWRDWVQGTVNECAQDGTIYAFVANPLVKPVVTVEEYDWWGKWWWAVMIGVIAFAIVAILIGYCVVRLLRYRKKYKQERIEKEDAHAELDEIAENDELGLGQYGQAGAGTHIMVNPLGPAGQMQGSDNAEIMAEKHAMKAELERQRQETRMANADVEMAGGDFGATTQEFGQEQQQMRRDV